MRHESHMLKMDHRKITEEFLTDPRWVSHATTFVMNPAE